MFFDNFKRLAGATALVTALGISGGAQAATVDTVLSLLIDVSGSVDATEYNLQRTGYVNAFNDASIIAAITDTSDGRLGKIAVNVVQFGTNASEVIGMTVIDSAATSSAFATALSTMARSQSGSTAIGRGISEAISSINAWLAIDGNSANRRVIDVSGDGANNSGTAPSTVGAPFCTAGGVINGIAIGSTGLKTYYENNVRCGGGFVLQASSFDDFDQAIRTKLRAEITGEDPDVIPLPAAAWLLLGGLGSLAAFRRRKTA